MVTLPPPPAAVEDVDFLFVRPSPHAQAQPPVHKRCSVFRAAAEEAHRYKWIGSERAGRDLGPEALRRWAGQHWRGFLRACCLEHLQGRRYWVELDRGDFGLLARGGMTSGHCSPRSSGCCRRGRRTWT